MTRQGHGDAPEDKTLAEGNSLLASCAAVLAPLAVQAIVRHPDVQAIIRDGVREALGAPIARSTPTRSESTRSPDYLTKKEVSSLVRLSVRQIDRLVSAGRLEAIRVGKSERARLLFRRSDVEALLGDGGRR